MTCLANPNRLAMRQQNENEEPHVNVTRAVPVCASCGQEGHSRSTHRSCPNYHSNNNDDNSIIQENLRLHNIGRISNNGTPPRHSLGLMNVEYNSCHARLFIQERTSRSSLRNPTFNLCCQEGAVELPQLNPTPPEVSQLLHGSDAAAIHFRTNIRAYNNALSFTSLGVNINETVANSRGGAYNFRIYGNVYHRIGSLLPAEDNRPAFAQIYVHNPATETANRQAVSNAQLNNTTLETLQALIHRLNPFVRSFQNIAQIARNQGIDNVRMVIRSENTPDRRRYNAPTAEEVGIIIIDNHDENIGNRDIVLRTRSNQLERISEMHRFYDALQYVLIFPQ
ncbi:hypothetical protein INT45_002605, partial [Circinella minor]